MNIITPGFPKSVWGNMGGDLLPRESKSRMFVQGQIGLTTDCSYTADNLHIATLIAPNDKPMESTLTCPAQTMDFSQTPMLARALPLQPDAEFKFTSLNPQSNSLLPLTLRIQGSEKIRRPIATRWR
ncbi:MAG: hypothetical protein ACR2NX_13825 [Chthoniobacterales bacterium]